MKIPFKLTNDHIVARLEDRRLALLDTGSPLSLADSTFEFGWESYRPLMPIPDAEALAEQVGEAIDVLVGMDVLRTLCLTIDWMREEIEVLPDAPTVAGMVIPLTTTAGELTLVPAEFEGRTGMWIVDTGARVSFVADWNPGGSDEPWRDFVLQGEVSAFEEPSRVSEIALGGCRRQGRVVRLPRALAPALDLAKANGILGVDLMKQSMLILDFANKKMVVTR